jgi:hypothetical protein
MTRYAIIIPDGCADEPQDSLGGRTPLQAARTPHMDRIAREGVVGRSDNVPAPLTPASDVATLSLFGYDPLVVYTGRAPLETAAMGISLGPEDWAVRCNLVNAEGGRSPRTSAQASAPLWSSTPASVTATSSSSAPSPGRLPSPPRREPSPPTTCPTSQSPTTSLPARGPSCSAP